MRSLPHRLSICQPGCQRCFPNQFKRTYARSSSSRSPVFARAFAQALPQDLAEWGRYQDDKLGGPPSLSMLRAQHKQQLPVEERQELAQRLRRGTWTNLAVFGAHRGCPKQQSTLL